VDEFSEFVRNELLLKNIWIDGFKYIGLSFPSEAINGVTWGFGQWFLPHFLRC